MVASLECWDAVSNRGPAQSVKGSCIAATEVVKFDPWPRNSICHRAVKNKTKQNKTKKKTLHSIYLLEWLTLKKKGDGIKMAE